MMAPLPISNPLADRPELPRVRLEVRTGSGRTVSYEVGSDEFLIGGASGCDLRLPGVNLPPVACQITRKTDGVRVRRLTPVLPVHINDRPISANATTAVNTGDRLTLAGFEIELVIHQSEIVAPRFVPLDGTERPQAYGTAGVPADVSDEYRKLDERKRQLDAEEAQRRDEWQRRDADLVRRTRDLEHQTEDLESDRVIWYRRRQEMEQELERLRTSLTSPSADPHQEAELLGRERELARVKDDLSTLREQLLRQFHERRDELARAQEMVREERAALAAERAGFTAECDQKRSILEAELSSRRDVLQSEFAGHGERTRGIAEQQDRLAAGFQELARQRELFAADRDLFDKSRAKHETERAAETVRLNTWDETLRGREADVARRDELAQHERAEFERERAQLHDDLLRLERRTAAIEEKELAAETRVRNADVRLEQLRRDAAEWEETVRLAAAEQDRLRAEAERLDRHKVELDSQTALLATRAGELESQQAVLNVLRAKIERTRQEADSEAVRLVAARAREEESQDELRARIREAELLRAQLDSVQENTELERQRLDERDSLLAASLEEIRVQREAIAAEEARLREREAELDSRSAEFADQAGTLKGRITQALDLQARLEADRVAVREREAALAQSEDARQLLQEQLRRRAEDLAVRTKSLEDQARQLAADRAAFERAKADSDATRGAAEDRIAELQRDVENRSKNVDRLAEEYAEKERTLALQVGRLREVGAAVAAERKYLTEAQTEWESTRLAAQERDRIAREEIDAFRKQAAGEIELLRAQAPELEDQSRAAMERLAAARDMLRGHLTELNDYARLSREDLDAIRAQVRQEAERLREQEETLNRAKGEHRLAVTAFRQQLIEWQGQVAEMKRALSHSETHLEARHAAVELAAKHVNVTTHELAEQAERLRHEREEVAGQRSEMERHLADMREWYRRKLRELASGKPVDERDMPALKLHEPADGVVTAGKPSLADGPAFDELNPGDRQLGELLRSLDLVDADTLAALWSEASRQHRTLRQVLLASGVVTLYQLALIEAGNLDGLMLGRLRVIDRSRSTPREAIYRVFDPRRADATRPGTASGVFMLRHLAETEMLDAVHPDEFRQRFAAVRDAAHPNLAAVVEVLDINGRPAVLMEWLTGLFSADLPPHAGHPGCWVRLVTMAAGAIDAAHRHGLIHGRLTSDAFALRTDGVLKVTGFGEPPWLTTGLPEPGDTSVQADLRAFGQVIFGWSQLAGAQRAGARTKSFPDSLLAVIRRLEADVEPPMADTVAAEQPYESAAELLADMNRVARETPFSDDAWEKLLKHVAENAPDAPASLKRSA